MKYARSTSRPNGSNPVSARFAFTVAATCLRASASVIGLIFTFGSALPESVLFAFFDRLVARDRLADRDAHLALRPPRVGDAASQEERVVPFVEAGDVALAGEAELEPRRDLV